jgi:hypothetical protein
VRVGEREKGSEKGGGTGRGVWEGENFWNDSPIAGGSRAVNILSTLSQT